MSRRLTVTVDATKVSPSKVIRESAGAVPLAIVTARMLLELADELGGQEQAGRFLLSVAEQMGKPIGVNVPTPSGSRSMFLAPRSWTRERLAGWVAGHHEQIEGTFGMATPVAEGEW